MIEHVQLAAKPSGDIASVSILFLTMQQILPSIASLVTIVWVLIRIYETETIRRMLKKETHHENKRNKYKKSNR